MHRLIKADPGRLADAGFVVSAGGTAWTWLANVNEILQFVALCIAIASGIYTLRYHVRKNKEQNKDS